MLKRFFSLLLIFAFFTSFLEPTGDYFQVSHKTASLTHVVSNSQNNILPTGDDFSDLISVLQSPYFETGHLFSTFELVKTKINSKVVTKFPQVYRIFISNPGPPVIS